MRNESSIKKDDCLNKLANPTADELRSRIYSNMSLSQKWKEACRLRDTAWKLKTAAIRAQHPDWNDLEVRNEVRKIFLYGFT